MRCAAAQHAVLLDRVTALVNQPMRGADIIRAVGIGGGSVTASTLFGPRSHGLQQLYEHCNQSVRINGLRHVNIKSSSDGAVAILCAGERRDRDSGYPSGSLFSLDTTNACEKVVSILAGHPDVRDDHVRTTNLRCLTSTGGAARRTHWSAVLLE
jgi:hypothetical protein